MVKELPYKTKTVRQNQRMRLRYTHYNSRSAARVGPRTHVILGNLSVCRRHNNIVYLRNDGFDDKLSWSDHAANVARSFASKLSLLRRMRFLPQKQLEDFYTKVILPSVTYGLTVWGSCNKTHLNNLEKLLARAGRIVYGLPWDTSAEDVLMRTGWDSLERMYKLRLTEFVFKCLKGYTVTELKICFYRGIQAAGEMRTSFFHDQKQILSGTPYTLEEQSHGTF